VLVHLLHPSGSFEAAETSAALPQLPLAELGRFLDRIGTDSETQIVRAFRTWVRERFASR